jgi:hypothetical protein
LVGAAKSFSSYCGCCVLKEEKELIEKLRGLQEKKGKKGGFCQ